MESAPTCSIPTSNVARFLLWFVASAALLCGITSRLNAADPPVAITLGSTNVTANAATVKGIVNPSGSATSVFFQWGTTTNHGATTATQTLAAGSVAVPVQATFSPLSSNAVYHYRLVATNAAGMAFGKDFILTTGEGLALNEGESWTYEFHDLPFVRQSGCTVCGGNFGAVAGTFGVVPESFLSGAILLEIFEDVPGGTMLAVSTNSAPATAAIARYSSFGTPWGDHQGAVRLTVLSGSAVITNVGFSLDAEGFRIIDRYGNNIVPSKIPQPPLLVSQSISNISFQSVIARAEVNPRNTNASIYFQWGATTNYGFASPLISTNRDYGVAVAASLSGLNPGANYHVRTVVSNAVGVVFGPDIAFSTLIPSSVTTQPASSLRSTSAVLNASINANGFATTVVFEWGSTTNYGQVTPTQNIGSPTAITNVSALVTGLSEELLYHYRVVAVSAGVTNRGEDVGFNTTPVPAHVVITNIATQDVRFALETGGSVVFACDGVVALSNQIEIANNVSVDASGHSVTFSGSHTSRIFQVVSGVGFALTNITLADGQAGRGGAALNAGTLYASDCRFVNNQALGSSGANGTNGTDGISSTTDRNAPTDGGTGGTGFNGEAAEGGAVWNIGSVFLKRCLFEQNSAMAGTGGDGGGGGAGGSFCVGIQCDPKSGGQGGLGGNGGASLGGCIYNAGTLSAVECSFERTIARASAGGMGGTGGALGRASTSSPNHPGAGGTGGTGGNVLGAVIFNSGIGGTSNCTFRLNIGNGGFGGDGGRNGPFGFGWYGGTGGGGGLSFGGTIYNRSNWTAVNCTFVSNQIFGANGGVGGRYNFGGCISPAGDGGSAWGGSVANEGILSVFSSTFHGNQAVGGVSTISTLQCAPRPGETNDVPYDGTNGLSFGGNIAVLAGTLTVANTIVAFGSSNNCHGAIIDGGHNISSDATPTWTSGTSSNNVDPLLLPLANNGGPTLTMALRVGSPALNAADPATSPATDQRGVPRPVGSASDIGAYEGLGVPALEIIRENSATNMIRWFAEPARVYRLEQTSNLKDWTPIATNTVGADGFLNFPVSANPSPRFFRVVAQ